MENIMSALPALRANVADQQQVTYGVEREYAKALNSVFDFRWYEVEHADVSDTAKLVHVEKKALFVELKRVKHSNPSTVWARIRKYGRAEAKEASLFDEVPESEGQEGEGNSQAGNTRSPMLRNVEDLTALYKFNARQEALPREVYNAQQYIVAALKELGVDISLIK